MRQRRHGEMLARQICGIAGPKHRKVPFSVGVSAFPRLASFGLGEGYEQRG